MQIPYNCRRLSLNYLNCYVRFSFSNGILSFYNTLYDKKVFLKGDESLLKEILTALHKGVSTNDLFSLLKRLTNSYEELYTYLLQNFIIE